ncbi:MAG: type VI secretion system tip protein VgrG [Hellea sp.]|nr:type VI secretion system tip protein VgrG [Hellea sp.]
MGANHRETRLNIDLGDDEVDFVSMSARESISHPFEVELQITSPLGELDIAPHLGKPVGLSLFEDDKEVRYFNGILTEGVYLRESADGFVYNLTLRSFLYFLDSRIGFAIFQEKNVLDVIKEVMAEAGISDVDYRTSESYENFEYCVQYGESDFNFISRLMEQEGLYYFFEHTEDKHVLVICDKNSHHKKSKEDTLAFNPTAEASRSYRVSSDWGEKHYIKKWTEKVSSTGHKKVSLRDFNFEKPKKPVDGVANEKKTHPKDEHEYYAYPGLFIDDARAKRLSDVNLEVLRTHRISYAAEATAKGLCVGTKIKVNNHPNIRFNVEYFIISTVHVMQSQSYRSGTGARDKDNVHFIAIPVGVQYRAQQITEKPRVIGLESAIVTGPEGETIYTDKYGRIKVRFHWDRAKTKGEKSTCWIRVSQTGGLGNIVLPRVGHEVLVDFLNGDPDRPVITGRVFNKDHMPTYELPANKTRAVWRTLTYGEQTNYPDTEELDTGKPQANELRFEDKGGKEEVFLHAERDMNVRVCFDYSRKVGHNELVRTGFDRQRYVGNDEKIEIKGNKTYTLTKNEDNVIEEGDRTTSIDKGSDKLTIKQGNLDVKANSGKMTIEAAQSIELIVGQTKLKLTPSSATLSSTMIKIEAKGMATIKAGGIMTQQGALIKIN